MLNTAIFLLTYYDKKTKEKSCLTMSLRCFKIHDDNYENYCINKSDFKVGHWGIATGTGCVTCNCSAVGSLNMSCDYDTGQCQCRPGVGGKRCDTCQPGYYGFSQNGCQSKYTIYNHSSSIYYTH